MENFYTVDDLTKLLNVPKSTIYFWRTTHKDGFPEPVRIGKYLKWDKVSFDLWVQAQMKPTNLADNLGEVFTAMTELTTAISNDTDLKKPLQGVKDSVEYALENM